jgi:hypothetical protein
MKIRLPIAGLALLLLLSAHPAPAQTFYESKPADAKVENTATGKSALSADTSGSFNTAAGGYALEKNTTGSLNTATGFFALNANTSGDQNTATGYTALSFNTTGHDNTAVGCYALEATTIGHSNTAVGSSALKANVSGIEDVALGGKALYGGKTGSQNLAAGFSALEAATGSHNTAIGTRALSYLIDGDENIALGYEAGYAVAGGNSNIEIGSVGDKADTATIRLGTPGTQKQAFVAGIFGTTAAGGVPVVVTSTGQLGTLTSSARFKRDIRDMGNVAPTLMALRPVTFEYTAAIDPAGAPQFGLVAEEVAKVAPALVVRDAENRPYSVRYEAVNAMLLDQVQQQQRTIMAQQKLLDNLAARVAQLERSRGSN